MANLITIFRILASAALLFCPALSPAFFAVYIFAGITDMLDGFVARKIGTASDFGAKLDTVADLALIAVCLCKLLPILDLSGWLYGWIALIALIKVVNIVSGYVVKKGVRIAPYPYEQSDRRFAVSPAADVVLHRIEICSCAPLHRRHLRRRPGGPFHPNGAGKLNGSYFSACCPMPNPAISLTGREKVMAPALVSGPAFSMIAFIMAAFCWAAETMRMTSFSEAMDTL